MLKKKILLSLFIIGAVGTILAANTWAFLTDTVTSTGNEIKTGTLHLTLDPDTSLLKIEGVSPGDSGNLDQTIINTGTIPGKLKIDFSDIQESVAIAAPSTNGTSTLLDSVLVNIKLVKASDGSLVKQLAGTDLDTVSIASCSGLSVSNIPIDTNTEYELIIRYEIPSNTDTGIQGKKLTFGVTYKLNP